MDGIFPVVDTVYDYFVDSTAKTFIHWKANLSTDWTFPEEFVFYFCQIVHGLQMTIFLALIFIKLLCPLWILSDIIS